MRYNDLAKTDLKISLVGQGSGQFGSYDWGYNVNYSANDIKAIVKTSMEHGINFFDTAESYGDGLSESLIGVSLKNYNRDEYILITKVAPWNLTYNKMIKSVDRSLKRLGVDYIDIYLIHYPNPFISLRETMKTLEYLRKKGKIRYIGVSNFSKILMQKSQEYLSSSEIIVNEVEFNLFSKRMYENVKSYCSKNNISIIAYSPLSGGLLSGKYDINNLPKDKARAFNFTNRESFLNKNKELIRTITRIAKEKNCTISQLALSYIVSNSNCYAIPTALTVDEVIINSEATNFLLTRNELSTLNCLSKNVDLFTYFFDHFFIRPISWSKEAMRNTFFSTQN